LKVHPTKIPHVLVLYLKRTTLSPYSPEIGGAAIGLQNATATPIPIAVHSIEEGKNDPNMSCVGAGLHPAGSSRTRLEEGRTFFPEEKNQKTFDLDAIT
jgi:hypothetical protein